MSKGNCSRRGYTVNCEGPFTTGFKLCDPCRGYMNKNINNGTTGCMSKYPTPQKYIYLIINKKSKTVDYIGETKQGSKRMYEHFEVTVKSKNGSKQFRKDLTPKERQEQYDWMWVEDCWDLSKSEMRELEYLYIKRYKPILNGKK